MTIDTVQLISLISNYMEKSKATLMTNILSKLKDVLDSQEVLIAKTAEIQIDLIEVPSRSLNKTILEIYTNLSTNLELTEKAFERYHREIDLIS